MNVDNEDALNFYFDTYSDLNSLKEINTRDKSHRLKVLGEFKEGNRGERGVFFDGSQELKLEGVDFHQEEFVLDTPSFFILFKYQEPLPERYRLVQLTEDPDRKFSFYLTKKGEERVIDF